jgi:hypothetical protein
MDAQNWSVMIDADLRFVVPVELRSGRSDAYDWQLSKRAAAIKPQHESMPWRAYEQALAAQALTPAQLQLQADFEGQPENQSIANLLRSEHYLGNIYQLDLNWALADVVNLDRLNWRFDSGYYQRYYGEQRDSMHCISGASPIQNPGV